MTEVQLKSSYTIGILMAISGVTHVAQLFVYDLKDHVIGASIFGVIYFGIGIGVLTTRKLSFYWSTAILPTIGGILGTYRYFYLQANPFSVFHVAIDIIVVPLSFYLIYKISKSEINDIC